MRVLTDPAPDSSELAYACRALEQGELVLVPTDTVYGLAALASDATAVARLYECKGRSSTQQTAIVYPSITMMRSELPWLGTRAMWAVQALLPGPWTLVVDNPHGVLPWLTGGEEGPLGIRVPAGMPALPPIAATSANGAGAPTIERVDELDVALAEQICCAIDRGRLSRASESTVLDLVAWEHGRGEVRVLRDTARRAGQAIAVLAPAPKSVPPVG